MFVSRTVLNNLHKARTFINARKGVQKIFPHSCLLSNVSNKNEPQDELGQMASKYKVFKEEDSEIVIDVYEERLKYQNLLEEEHEKNVDDFAGINLERGLYGVFDIEDLVDVLRRENAQDIFVASVPKEIQYVDYICVVSGKSVRHLKAIAQFVKRVYKMKRHEEDVIPKVEGQNSSSWLAMDLGNIALHIFSTEARKVYDLETLWSVGPEYDKEYNKKDLIAEMLEKHSIYLSDLKPAT